MSNKILNADGKVLTTKSVTPITGWDYFLQGDNIAVIPANSLPYYKGTILIPDGCTANPFESTLHENKAKGSSKEAHFFVVSISDDANEKYKGRFKIGDRAVIHGSLIPVFINGRHIIVARCVDVVAILRRADGSVDPEYALKVKQYEYDLSDLVKKDAEHI
jgi:phosphoribosyl 1,2-cyclic phosphodiesterase